MDILMGGSQRVKNYLGEAALSLRSRRNGTKFAVPLLAELLIKCQRLPRGFFRNSSFPEASLLAVLQNKISSFL